MNLPRHPKAKHFHELALMAGVQSFAELEARIAELPTEQARGVAFEVFAEACLATQRIYQAREVWPGNSMPSALRQQLRLPMADTQDRVQRLDEVGFDWDPSSTRWEEMFQQLLDFKREHGHTNVSQRSTKYAALASWVKSQRTAKRYNRPIIAERGKRLEEIGFKWRIMERNVWDTMFERLIEFKKTYGHCNVPQKWPVDRRLGRWVNSNRFRTQRLKEHQIKKLDSIGFVWNMKPPKSKESI